MIDGCCMQSYTASTVAGRWASRIGQKIKVDCGRKECRDSAAYEGPVKATNGGKDKQAK
jgi:hypothetical protein